MIYFQAWIADRNNQARLGTVAKLFGQLIENQLVISCQKMYHFVRLSAIAKICPNYGPQRQYLIEEN